MFLEKTIVRVRTLRHCHNTIRQINVFKLQTLWAIREEK